MRGHLDDNDVNAFFTGALSSAERESIQKHVDGCSACRVLVAEVARRSGARAHIVHLSSAGGLEIVHESSITAETTPHYLFFDAEGVPDGATEFKCAPPIREHENREALWQGLARGVIDLVVSDHSPCTPALKGRERGDFAAAMDIYERLSAHKSVAP